jgi:uncharacterized protein YjbI with pentapeptide repeats
MPYRRHSLTYGLTLTEVLGAIAISITIASLALISTKDTLLSGQRSAIQRELQTLNSALNSFKAAGGTIASGSSAMEAIRQMREGVGVSDLEYSPLIREPDEMKKLGDQTYRLNYDDSTGFNYVPDDTQQGFFGDSGREINPQSTSTYAFDPSNPSAVAQALQALSALHPEDPAYSASLEALNAAFQLGTVTSEELMQAGLVLANGTWIRPIFDINDPDAALAVAQSLGSYRNNIDEYTARIASLNASLAVLSSTDQTRLNPILVAEFLGIAVANRPAAATLADWSQINISQGLQALYGTNYLFQRTLTGLNVTGEQFNGLQAIVNSSISGLNLSGIDLTSMELVNVNMSNVTGINGTNLNDAKLYSAVLTNVDMTGYDATDKNISRLNFTSTNLTMDMIKDAQKTNLSTIFTGTGITAQDLLDAGWSQEQLVNARF